MPFNKIKSIVFRKDRFSDKRVFFDALGQADSDAIRFLAQKISYSIRQSAFKARLAAEDVEELINDAIVITIGNIQQGKVQFMDYSPVAYALGVSRRLMANRIRSKKPPTEELDQVHLASDFNPEVYLKNKEQEKIIGQLLAKLEENCRLLIRLKFFHQKKDREIIEEKLSPYHSVDTVKSKRSQCLKKLARLATAAGGKQIIDF